MRSSVMSLLVWLLGCAVVQAGPRVITLNTPREFPGISTAAQWQERARQIREQILVSSGLWPLPEKTPLQAVVFGKIIRDGYSVEKVYFQTYPGFYLAGNLYRPLGRGPGPFPAILNPHGHWSEGRLVDNQDCSIPGRCINFARQGMIAFAYDLVGYNDTHFADPATNASFADLHHDFATHDPASQLWGVSLMGLQTWNSLRALDFIASLPDADPHRLACTGASGGGTQTFMLGAIDDRLAALAPVVMVSHIMQGGCLCENMPGLRVQFSNVEIAAAAAPRPQIVVAATGDWTRMTPAMEGPAIAHVYNLLNASNNFRAVQFDFHHNYNQTSREAVYQWFDQQLLGQPDVPVRETAFKKEPDEDLRVFPDGKLPADALTQAGLIKYLIHIRAGELRALEPHDGQSLAHYRTIMQPAWAHTLQLESPAAAIQLTTNSTLQKTDYTARQINLARPGESQTRTFTYFTPSQFAEPVIVVLAHPDGAKHFLDASSVPTGLARQLLDRHWQVAVIEAGAGAGQDELSVFFTCYNRTRLQTEVRDLISICRVLKHLDAPDTRVVLCGSGHAAFWCLLAAPGADAVIADCGQLNTANAQYLLAPGLFCPGLRKIDTYIGGPLLAAPHPLLLHNLARNFPTHSLASVYEAFNAKNKFETTSHVLADEQITTWIAKAFNP